ncbi:Cytochrome P450 94A2 [Hibiscus syriacus]|uniref:Cytochrome P450 94A2 n=1 Tax=Hibiscus syriacus TaxID=106335 RepID=A0A6A3AV06_HIBSY|nr:Cytochrome P450 94A2 [Hibiscus syriacus]
MTLGQPTILPLLTPFHTFITLAIIFFLIKSNLSTVSNGSHILQNCPSATYTLHLVFGYRWILTANPDNLRHILKTNFNNYPKGYFFVRVLFDFLGNGIFNANRESWKFERQLSSHEFNTKSLRKFVETVVDTEIHDRLVPVLSDAAGETVLDLQDVLQRFAFNNFCKSAFGHDPACLLPCLPQIQFADAFEEATEILFQFLGESNDFSILGRRENSKSLSLKFLSSGHSDENFVTDIVISFILAGRDTTSAALTWFFWLIYEYPEVEKEILKEIKEKSDTPVYEEVKVMVYVHVSLCESMRLYPPAMGRMEKVWGTDWADFKPERWLERDEARKWSFVGRDPYTYPVLNAGPRICLGKEMAFLQMKRYLRLEFPTFLLSGREQGGFSRTAAAVPSRVVENRNVNFDYRNVNLDYRNEFRLM